jgi:hypothetical protein
MIFPSSRREMDEASVGGVGFALASSLVEDGKVAEESLTVDAVEEEEEEEKVSLPPSTSTMTSTADEKVDGDGGGGSGEAAVPREVMEIEDAGIKRGKDTGMKAEKEAGSIMNSGTQGEESSAGLGGARVSEESEVQQGSAAPGGKDVDSKEMGHEAKKPCDACRGMHRAHTCERALPKPPPVMRKVAPEIVLSKRLPKQKKMTDSPVKKEAKEEQPKKKRCPPSPATVPLQHSVS